MSLEKLGQDEWVAQHGQRQRQQNPTVAWIVDRWQGLPRLGQIVILAAVPILLPLFVRNDYILRVGGLVWLYAVLALGLNIVVGLTGLLDLGYVAFFGVGGYTYALLSSAQFNIHFPTWVTLPLVTVLTLGLGFVLGLPSLRLQGDYLAIVTLGFGQIFVQLMTAMNRVNVPWSSTPVDLTGGPNGIIGLDPINLLGLKAANVTAYYYLLLLILALVLAGILSLNRSRIGRAWRAVREDSLAAEAMGIPVNRMRLLAFAVGAAIAGCVGCLFAAWQGSVFPGNFDTPLLITLYAMVVLGGVGSLWGMVAGAFVITVIPEVLRPGTQISGSQLQQMVIYGGTLVLLAIVYRRRQKLLTGLGTLIVGGILVYLVASALLQIAKGGVELQQVVFYGGTLVLLGLVLRPQRRFLVVLSTLFVTGLIVHLVAAVLDPTQFAGKAPSIVRLWLAIPADNTLATNLGNLLFFVVTGMLVLLTLIPKRFRDPVLIVALYLLAFVWETRLSQEPSTTVLLLTGAGLIMLMNYRPQGLFGQRRVEIV